MWLLMTPPEPIFFYSYNPHSEDIHTLRVSGDQDRYQRH